MKFATAFHVRDEYFWLIIGHIGENVAKVQFSSASDSAAIVVIQC